MRNAPQTDGPIRRLFASEHDAMVRLAVLLVSSSETAEDIVQESFAAIEPRWDTIENHGAYLRASVVNGCRMALRRREIEQRHLESMVELGGSADADGLAELLDALDGLSERHRTAIILRFFSDLPFREIADAMDCPPSTARSLVRRGLRALRDELEKADD